MTSNLPKDSKDRKERPIATGVLDYFPDALAAVANVSFVGNQQHNPGQKMHWAREKSTDHADCIARHLVERGTIDTDGLRHTAKAAWRALALLQIELEEAAKKEPTYLELRYAQSKKIFDSMLDGSVIPMTDMGIDPDHGFSFMGFQYVPRPVKTFYIAGPMRGYPKFNFPAFDKARDLGLTLGHKIISPADLDRASGFHEDSPPMDATSPQITREFVTRDTKALLSLRSENGDGIALLPGWEKSTGALAELFVARWLGLKVVNAETFEPFTQQHLDYVLTVAPVGRAIRKYLGDKNAQ